MVTRINNKSCFIAYIPLKLYLVFFIRLIGVSVINSAWGKKRVCAGCSVRYYDLKSPTPSCPKCGTFVDLQPVSRSKKRVFESIGNTDISSVDSIELVEDIDIGDVAGDIGTDVLESDSFVSDIPDIAGLEEGDI